MLINYPVEDRTISQHFGVDNTNDPAKGDFYTVFGNKHPGVDFPVQEGTEVFASFPGIVVRNEYHKGMGNVIGIRNGNIVALYTHLSEATIKAGQIVKDRELIGLSGATGDACLSPHLHFELRDISKPSLKDMVFEPIFGKEILQYADTFIYSVNNKNTKKTLVNLSKLYYGTDSYWQKINESNGFAYEKDEILSDGLSVIIPNY
jgi:murein DD-endopeptidase MepM/ murein hydrolase activator NlpD